jgi:hypothetical protein
LLEPELTRSIDAVTGDKGPWHVSLGEHRHKLVESDGLVVHTKYAIGPGYGYRLGGPWLIIDADGNTSTREAQCQIARSFGGLAGPIGIV